jgi:hypothetical protein
MKIKTLIQSELDETAKFQAEWQRIVKKAILDNWPNKANMKAAIEKAVARLPEKMVKRCIGLGLEWANRGELS